MSLVHSLLGLVVPTVSFYHGMQKACTKISCPWKCIFVEGMKPIFAFCPIGPVENQLTGKPKKIAKKIGAFIFFL